MEGNLSTNTGNKRLEALIALLFGRVASVLTPNGNTGHVRAVYTSASLNGGYTVGAKGLITASTNGAIGAQDGVAVGAGEAILLPSWICIAAGGSAADAGVYVIVSAGSAGTPIILARVNWWPQGATFRTGASVNVGGEGTLFKNTTWVAMFSAQSFLIGTQNPQLFPIFVGGSTALISGTMTLAVPVFSAKTAVVLARIAIGGTVTSTVQYVPSVSAGTTGLTIAAAGSMGSVVVTAQPAAGNATVSADTSTLNWGVYNQAA